MLIERIRTQVEPMLRPGETVKVAMAGFRPLTRSAALAAIFPMVLGGLAVSTAAGWPAWVGGGIGGAGGAAVAAWLDQRRARAEHRGRGMSVGLVVTDRRLILLELETGLIGASVAGIGLEAERFEIERLETERMQGSGLKRPGVVVTLRDGTVLRVIPARTDEFLAALR